MTDCTIMHQFVSQSCHRGEMETLNVLFHLIARYTIHTVWLWHKILKKELQTGQYWKVCFSDSNWFWSKIIYSSCFWCCQEFIKERGWPFAWVSVCSTEHVIFIKKPLLPLATVGDLSPSGAAWVSQVTQSFPAHDLLHHGGHTSTMTSDPAQAWFSQKSHLFGRAETIGSNAGVMPLLPANGNKSQQAWCWERGKISRKLRLMSWKAYKVFGRQAQSSVS